MSAERRPAALAEEPKRLDAVQDAYIAALTEHLALSERIDVRQWTEKPERFFDDPFSPLVLNR